jgi:hypothetical protein
VKGEPSSTQASACPAKLERTLAGSMDLRVACVETGRKCL